ncbi:MAG TPA: hypothetical protein VLL52_01610, partial [Anaerolineae bacterium]|nr:hypothetical protein [Anaerolineae bacterium]
QPTPTSESDPTGFITGTYNNYDKPADRAYIYAVDASNPTDLWRFVIINIPQPPAGGGESYAVMEPFSIELPPGTYRLFAWSEDGSDYVAHATTLGGWQTVTVTADETKANINLWPPDSRYCARFAIPASPDNLFAGTTPNCGAAIRGVLLEPPTDAFYIDVYAVAVNDPTKYYKTSISQELDGSFPVYELLVDPGSYEIYAYADETDYGWGYAPDGDNLNQVNVANNSTILSDANLNPHISANKCHGFDMPDSPDGTYSGPIATGLVPCDDNNNPLWNRQPAQQLTTVELAAGTSQAYNLDGDSDTTNDIQFTDNGGQLQIQIQNGTRLYRGLGPNYAHDNGCPRAWEENQADFTTTPYIITVTDLCVYTSQGNLAELNISLVATTDTSFEFSFTTTLYTPNTSQ